DPTEGRVDRLIAISHASFIDVSDGTVLPDGPTRMRKGLAQSVAQVFSDYRVSSPSACTGDTNTQSDTITACDEQLLDVLRAADTGDYDKLKTLAYIDKDKSGNAVQVSDDRKGLRFAAALDEIQSDTRYATLTVALQKRADLSLPQA